VYEYGEVYCQRDALEDEAVTIEAFPALPADVAYDQVTGVYRKVLDVSTMYRLRMRVAFPALDGTPVEMLAKAPGEKMNTIHEVVNGQ